jgi:hypothetical protein
MKRFIIIGIIIAIIIGITILSILVDLTGVMKPMPESQEETNENPLLPQGRNLSIEFDEKMGFSAP